MAATQGKRGKRRSAPGAVRMSFDFGKQVTTDTIEDVRIKGKSVRPR